MPYGAFDFTDTVPPDWLSLDPADEPDEEDDDEDGDAGAVAEPAVMLDGTEVASVPSSTST
jgi:hypothetical protein